jgi:hypothetical protein
MRRMSRLRQFMAWIICLPSRVGRTTALSLPDNHAGMSGAKRRARPTGLFVQ